MSETKKQGRGVPAKGSDQAKSVHLDMRISPTEREGFRAAANLAGLGLSAWIRERLRLAARKELESAGQDVPFIQAKGG
jgi:uncharacterized protein (DUF1778 family)